MQPLIVAGQVTQGGADFLRTAFPPTTPGFIGLLERFLVQRENIFKGPYLAAPAMEPVSKPIDINSLR